MRGIRAASYDCRIALWGDSLTAESAPNGQTGYGLQLEGLMPSRIITIQGVGGDTSAQIEARQTADTQFITRENILWAGRNDLGNGVTVAQTVAHIAAMIAHINHPRFAILSVLNAEGESPGTANYIQMAAINALLLSTYPSNYLEVREVLVAAYNPSLSQDVIDNANDTVPTSLRSDAVHLNTAGYAIVAGLVQGFLVSKGW